MLNLVLLQGLCGVIRVTSCGAWMSSDRVDGGCTTLSRLVALQVEGSRAHHGVRRCGEDLILVVVHVGTDGLRVIVIDTVPFTTNHNSVVVHHLSHHLATLDTLSISGSVLYLIERDLHVELSDAAACSNAHTGRPTVIVLHLAWSADFGLTLHLVECLLVLELDGVLHVLLACGGHHYLSWVSDVMGIQRVATILTDHRCLFLVHCQYLPVIVSSRLRLSTTSEVVRKLLDATGCVRILVVRLRG